MSQGERRETSESRVATFFDWDKKKGAQKARLLKIPHLSVGTP